MTHRALITIACAGCICLLMPTVSTQNPPNAGPVEVSGLNPTYTSCELVKFTVKNISQQELYFEVYAEQLQSDSWNDAENPYDIRDPRSLYIMKRVNINPKMLQPDASESLTWDRCLRPTWATWVKGDKAFRNGIIEKDSKSNSPILQRLRVDTYVRPEFTQKSLRRAYSEPFKRITNKSTR
jgi:hypothetical protein